MDIALGALEAAKTDAYSSTMSSGKELRSVSLLRIGEGNALEPEGLPEEPATPL